MRERLPDPSLNTRPIKPRAIDELVKPGRVKVEPWLDEPLDPVKDTE